MAGPPSLGFNPGLTSHCVLESPMGMLWSWMSVSPCPDTPLHPNPACGEAASPSTPSPVGSLLPAHFTFNYPDTSRGLAAKVCDECRGERHFGLRKDTRRLACLPLRLILDSICSLLCGALAGSQPGELKAPAQSSLSPAAGRRRGRRRREEEAPGPWGPPKAGWFFPPQQGLLQHPRASPAAACCEVSQSPSDWFGLEDHLVPICSWVGTTSTGRCPPLGLLLSCGVGSAAGWADSGVCVAGVHFVNTGLILPLSSTPVAFCASLLAQQGLEQGGSWPLPLGLVALCTH